MKEEKSFMGQSLYAPYIYHRNPLLSIQREYSWVIMDFATPETELDILREFMSLPDACKINP